MEPSPISLQPISTVRIHSPTRPRWKPDVVRCNRYDNIAAVNDAPVLTLNNPVGTIPEGSSIVGLSSLIGVADVDSAAYVNVVVKIPSTNGYFTTTWTGAGTVTTSTIGPDSAVSLVETLPRCLPCWPP